ncbi:MAG: HIT family protein [Candidatus Dadabacteria bacterium]|nr:MAG: HIT family protein [Candidatus Dadabacteria bacterium]
MATSDDCIFCRIVEGRAEASYVYRDDLVTAFLDLHPVVEGHTLVVPNFHTATADGIDEGTAGRMFAVGARIATTMGRAGIRNDGYNLFLANGAAAGQTVFHAHLHVIPRRAGDGFSVRRAVFGRGKADREQLDALAERLRQALEQAT